MIATSIASNRYNDTFDISKTALDSHANMAIVGKHATIISETGQTSRVKPFTPDYDALEEVPIVHAAVQWNCPNTDEVYMLLIQNALYIPSMEENLIPPFLMREAGVDKFWKIQTGKYQK